MDRTTIRPAGPSNSGLARSASPAPPWLARFDAVLERGVIWSIGLLLFFSIVFMGGRYDWGWLAWTRFVLTSTLALATLLWLIRLALRPQLGLVFSWSLVLL